MKKWGRGVFIFGVILMMAAITVFDAPNYFVFSLLLLFVVAVIFSGSKQGQFDYLQQILATSKIGFVASGLSEIVGTAQPFDQLYKSPIGKLDCVAYIYTVEEKRVTENSDGNKQTSYIEIERQVACDGFYLQDRTGQIQVDAKNLQWFGFTPANEYQTAGYRYREYVLDEKTQVLMIGHVWYTGGEHIFKYSDTKDILAIAPLKWVTYKNKWRPLKVRAGFMLAIVGLYVAFIIAVPIYVDDNQLIFNLHSLVSWF